MYRPPAWLRIAIVTLVVAGTLVAAVADHVTDAGWISGRIDDFGLFMPVVFVAAHILSSLVFVPRWAMAIAAGTIWGFWAACIWSLIGATAGAVAGFLLARYVNAGQIVPEEMKRLGPLLRKAESGGWRTVMLVRLIPFVPHALTNYALGLTQLRVRDYALGSFLGLAPNTIVFVNLGLSGRHLLDGGAWLEPMLWGGALLVLTLMVPKLLRRAP